MVAKFVANFKELIWAMWKQAKKGGIGIYSEKKPRAFDDETNVEFYKLFRIVVESIWDATHKK